jgi:glutathione synthase/RimK-type ligase-like ATP-grasp enzyme
MISEFMNKKRACHRGSGENRKGFVVLNVPPSTTLRIAALYGSDSRDDVDAYRDRTHPLSGVADFPRIVQDAGYEVSALWITPSYFRRSYRWNTRDYDLVCNIITDPDQHPKTLGVAQQIEKSSKVPFINPPRFLPNAARDQVARIAAGIKGIRAPKTLRLQRLTPTGIQNLVKAEGFRFPAILRPLGSQNGLDARLVADVDEALAGIGGNAAHYLTEYVDYRSPDGVYRKWRFFCIGERVMARSFVVGTHWHLHARNRSNVPPHVDLAREERAFFDAVDAGKLPAITGIIRELAGKMKLDFFGLDCALTSREGFILFEANPTMNFGSRRADPKRPHKQSRLPLAVEAARDLVLRLAAREAPAAAGPAHAQA